MSSIPSLPAHISTVLVTGAGGYVGREVALLLLERYPTLKLVLTDLKAPLPVGNAKLLAADLCQSGEVDKIFQEDEIDAIIAFQGIMSGGSEANFDLGYHVNIDSHRVLLEAARKHGSRRTDGNKIVYVFSSSLAAYGGDMCKPEAFVDPAVTPLAPETSYGTAKAIVELYVFDYTRKGFIDGRIVRLPTVAVRPGLPSSAASSFVSGMIREPLQGQLSECPIATGMNDPILEAIPFWLTRASTVFSNLAYALVMDGKKFPTYSRSVNLPGISITTRQIIEALQLVGGQSAVDLLRFKKDPLVIAIAMTWPGAFDNTFALSLGFEQDDPKTGFLEAVKDFKKNLET